LWQKSFRHVAERSGILLVAESTMAIYIPVFDCFYMFAIAMLWPETRDGVYKFATFGEFRSQSMYDVLQVGI